MDNYTLLEHAPDGIDCRVERLLTDSQTAFDHFFSASEMMLLGRDRRNRLSASKIAELSAKYRSPLGGPYWLHGLRPPMEIVMDQGMSDLQWRRYKHSRCFGEDFYRQYLIRALRHLPQKYHAFVVGACDIFGFRAFDYARFWGYRHLGRELLSLQRKQGITDDSQERQKRSARILVSMTETVLVNSDLYQQLTDIKKMTGLDVDSFLQSANPHYLKTALRLYQSTLCAKVRDVAEVC